MTKHLENKEFKNTISSVPNMFIVLWWEVGLKLSQICSSGTHPCSRRSRNSVPQRNSCSWASCVWARSWLTKAPCISHVLQDEGERSLTSYLQRIDKKPSEQEHCVVGVVDEVLANSRAALPVVRHRTLEPDTIRSGRRFRHKTIRAPPRCQHTNLLGREPWFASNGHPSCDRL